MNSLFGPLDDVAGDAGHVDHPPRVGFFTDTSVCIGCKACEVACKQWNGVPAAEHLDLLGMSHDNTGALGANAWRHVAFIEQSSSRPSTWACPHRRGRAALAHGVGRLQALHARGLPGRVPDGRAVPHGVRLGRRAAGHLQRLRLLRVGVPVRRDRAAAGRRARAEVHAVLRPAARRPRTRLREGLPHRLDPVRRARRAARTGGGAGRHAARAGGDARPGSTAPTRTTASAATARSSCSSTSRRCTGCRRTRSCPRATPCGCGSSSGRRPGRSSPRPWAPSWGADEGRGGHAHRVRPAHTAVQCTDLDGLRTDRCAWPGWRVRDERARRAAAAAAAGRPLVLRAAHPQAARMGLADPRVPVRGRAVRRDRRCCRWAPTSPGGTACAAARASPRWPAWGRACTSWCPTSAGPCGSTTCCGWPSRRRR